MESAEGKPHSMKIPSLNLKSEKMKDKTSPLREEKAEGKGGEGKEKKKMVVPSLKLPTRSDRSVEKEGQGVLDNLID